MSSNLISNALANRNAFRLISYTLVFLMMLCVVMTIGSLIQNVMPEWHSGMIAGILLFIVIDRLFMYRLLKTLTPFSAEWAITLGTQWIVILLFMRLLLSYANGLDSFLAELSLFARGYMADFFSAEFVITLLLGLLVWVLPAQFLELLDEIGLEQKLALSEESVRILPDAVPAHQRLVNLIFSLGIFLVILTVLSRLNVRTILSNVSGLPDVEVSRFSGGQAGTLLYFVLGLALLSLSRLMSLQTHWNRQRIPVSSNNLTRQWGKYSLFFLLILAVFVSLLPSGDSLGLFSLLGTVLGFLISILFFIGQLVLLLISLLFSLPLLLLRGDSLPIGSLPPIPPLPTPPPESAVPPSNSALWALIKSIFLWGSLLAIIVFAIIHFVRQHSSIRAALRKSRVTNWLILAWQWLSRSAEKTGGTLSRVIANGWKTLVSRFEGKQILPRPDFISLRSLDPRRRIYFFYLAMIRRGAEQGLTRQPSQTPSEYAVTLEKALPSTSEDIDTITGAFVEARYSRQEVDSGKAELVKETWGRIRRALQSKSKNEQLANKKNK
jgi:hypothetical protein